MSQQAIPGRSTTPWGAIITFLMGIIYGVSPIDLLPDIIPILGLVDDVILVPLLLVVAIALMLRRKNAPQRATASAQAPPVIDVPVIPDSYRNARR